ncbi:acyl carrier protein [Maricaulis sp.]|uniref:acyl carrier protein n=1 Tax=Maricaulis sp. TaxID=1486257 RepID=UPI002622FD4B|nr:acyl carrier protein [Maricaulis sp.]
MGLDEVKAQIEKTLAQNTNIAADAIRYDEAMEDIGIRSADAVYMCGVLEETFEIEIDPSMIFELDTLGDFANEIIKLIGQK